MPLELKLRENGIWYIHGTINGQRYRESLGTRDKEIAAIAYAEAYSKIQKAAIYGVEEEATFADAAIKYLEDGKDPRFITPLIEKLGPKKLKQIKPGTIKALSKKLYPKALPATRNRQCITPAKAVINFAAELGMCSFIRIAKYKEIGSKKSVAADRDWHERFIANAVNLRIAAIDLLMYTTGVRITNVLELQPEDFDIARGVADLKETKNGEPHTLYLTSDLIDLISQIEPIQVKDGSTRMFGYLNRQSIYTPWKETCRRAGIPYLPPHQCGRHTFATEMIIRNNVDPKTTARLGGWKSVRLLLEKYVHPEGEEDYIHEVFDNIQVNRNDVPDNVVHIKTKKRRA